MPLYPFIILGALFLAVMILPPLVAAYIDYRRETWREAHGRGPGGPSAEGRRPGPGATHEVTGPAEASGESQEGRR